MLACLVVKEQVVFHLAHFRPWPLGKILVVVSGLGFGFVSSAARTALLCGVEVGGVLIGFVAAVLGMEVVKGGACIAVSICGAVVVGAICMGRYVPCGVDTCRVRVRVRVRVHVREQIFMQAWCVQ